MPLITQAAHWNRCGCCSKPSSITTSSGHETIDIGSKEEGHILIDLLLKRNWIAPEEETSLRQILDASAHDEEIPIESLLLLSSEVAGEQAWFLGGGGDGADEDDAGDGGGGHSTPTWKN